MVNGSAPTEGRVEICRNNSYGTICDDQWDVLDARVACRQLGYSGQGMYTWTVISLNIVLLLPDKFYRCATTTTCIFWPREWRYCY